MKTRPVFAISLAATFALAVLVPSAGGLLYDLRWPSTVMIMVMYAGMGLNTDTAMLKEGLGRWKLHGAVQGALFILAPLLSIAVFYAVGLLDGGDRAVGLLFVGAVPTTITSCIMLTRRYGGNAVGSLYNAVLSQLLGVVVTPLILSTVLAARFETVSSFSVVLVSLIQKMILPFAVGQLLRPVLHRLKRFGQLCSFYGIFFILYLNLAKVALQGALGTTLGDLALPLVAAVLLCMLQLAGTWIEGLALHLSREDRICLLFTGSQKTLGMGVPLASIYFASRADIAMDATLVIIAYYLAAMMLSVVAVRLVKPAPGVALGADV